MKIKAGIIGASGYTGYELIKILSGHKSVELAFLNSRTYDGRPVKSLYPDFHDENIRFTDASLGEMNEADLVFAALPSGESLEIVPKLNTKVIDLSADYRFGDVNVYEKVYGKSHKEKIDAAYGLPELFRKDIMRSRVIANPGCYATASILAALPIQNLAGSIIFDCKSGYSGAGTRPAYVNTPENYGNNIIAYNLTRHRHKYEINQFIKAKVSFTPHVLPVFRGIMCTMHVLLNKRIGPDEIRGIYQDHYKEEPFVKVLGKIPELHDAQGTNYCCLGGFEVDENNQLVVVSVIDNLLKGASGQAVQNMNIMYGLNETEGLEALNMTKG